MVLSDLLLCLVGLLLWWVLGVTLLGDGGWLMFVLLPFVLGSSVIIVIVIVI